MNSQPLAAHKSIELHEANNFKTTLCLAKSKLMQELVFDKDFKKTNAKRYGKSIQDLHELRSLYERVPFETPVKIAHVVKRQLISIFLIQINTLANIANF